MALFIWKDEYSVNIKKIDDQHKKLVQILNDLHSSMLMAKANTVLEQFLKELIDYTKYHFKTEEDLMYDYKYDKISEHKESHKNFTDKVLQFYDDFQQGKKMITVELLFFLKDWLVNHISGEDKLYTKHFNDNGVF